MRILFSVYKEEPATYNHELIDAVWIHTNWSAEEIEKHLALNEGFRAEIAIGEHLSFYDYYCFFEDCEELISRIKSIPSGFNDTKHTRTPTIFRIRETEPDSADSFSYPDDNHQFLFVLKRFECGASGFAAISLWAASHPLEMVFIGGIVYDFAKWAISKIRCFLGIKKHTEVIRPMILNTKKLYRNFAKVTNTKVRDCQIIKINRVNVGVFHVKIRTGTGKRFKLKCYASGKIESIEEVSNTKMSVSH